MQGHAFLYESKHHDMKERLIVFVFDIQTCRTCTQSFIKLDKALYLVLTKRNHYICRLDQTASMLKLFAEYAVVSASYFFKYINIYIL